MSIQVSELELHLTTKWGKFHLKIFPILEGAVVFNDEVPDVAGLLAALAALPGPGDAPATPAPIPAPTAWERATGRGWPALDPPLDGVMRPQDGRPWPYRTGGQASNVRTGDAPDSMGVHPTDAPPEPPATNGRKPNLAKRGRRRWTEQELSDLIFRHDVEEQTVKRIARDLKRTPAAITTKLAKIERQRMANALASLPDEDR